MRPTDEAQYEVESPFFEELSWESNEVSLYEDSSAGTELDLDDLLY